MHKSLKRSDITVRTFKTFKKWTISTIANPNFSGSREDPEPPVILPTHLPPYKIP